MSFNGNWMVSPVANGTAATVAAVAVAGGLAAVARAGGGAAGVERAGFENSFLKAPNMNRPWRHTARVEGG
jgi:hypothetical protein